MTAIAAVAPPSSSATSADGGRVTAEPATKPAATVTLTIDPHEPGDRVVPVWRGGAGAGGPSAWVDPAVAPHARACVDRLGLRRLRLRVDLGRPADTAHPDGHEERTIARACDAAAAVRAAGASPWLAVTPALDAEPAAFAVTIERLLAGVDAACRSAGGRPVATGADGRTHTPRLELCVLADPAIDDPARALSQYDHAVAAARRIAPHWELGGPGCADPARLDALLTHLFHRPPDPAVGHPEARPRCDLVSVEAPTLRLEPIAAARALVNVTLGSDVGRALPLVVASVDRSAEACDPARDGVPHALAMLRHLTQAGAVCTEACVAAVSDHLDLAGRAGLATSFHGGRGLVSVHDLPKPALHAVTWLDRVAAADGAPLRIAGLDRTPGLAAWGARHGDGARVLLAYDDDASDGRGPLRVRLARMPGATAQVYAVSLEQGDAAARWRELGSPGYLNLASMTALTDAARPAEASVWLASEPVTLTPGSLTLVET